MLFFTIRNSIVLLNKTSKMLNMKKMSNFLRISNRGTKTKYDK